MQSVIVFFITNFTLTFFIMGLLIAGAALALQQAPLSKATVIDIIFTYFILFNIAISFFYNFIMHVFFDELAAQFIDWPQSPFQTEVGFASLGFAVLGLMAFWERNPSLRKACVWTTTIFLWGAAATHLYELITADNWAPGNVGIVFWTDLLLPLIGFILLGLQLKYPKVRK